MAWKGDGSGRKDSARGGVSGGGGNKGGGSGNGGARTAKAVGNATVADHAIATGRVSAPSVPSGGVAKGNYRSQVDAYNDYAKAVGSYETRGFMDKALDFLAGGFYDAQEPMAGNPRSFAEGTHHSTSNPGGILGGLAGLAIPGLGMLTGPALGSTYTAAGLPEMWHGGLSQPDMRSGVFGNSTSPMGGTQAAANSSVGGGWLGGMFGGSMAGKGSYNPFGGHSNGVTKQVAPRPSIPQSQPQPATSWGQPAATKFPGFPKYDSYSPFKNNWSWG